jgi:uncharacterized integral membrane protein
MNVEVQTFLQPPHVMSSRSNTIVRLLDPMSVLCLVFLTTSILFSLMVVLIYIPTSSVQVSFPLHTLQYLLVFVVLIITTLPGIRL